MVQTVAEDHDVRFCAVPSEFAVDNGAMISWTGILSYLSGVTTPIEESYVKLRWRLEEVEVPWVKLQTRS
jgi:N6-L-threonylcarbamoyladenine synthase